MADAFRSNVVNFERGPARRLVAFAVVWIISIGLTMWASSATAAEKPAEQRYVVVLEESAGQPKEVAERHAQRHGAKVKRVFTKALDGYAAKLTAAEAKAIAREPGVAAVGLDPVGEFAAQSMPLGARRVFAADGDCSPGDNADVNQNLDINCLDDVRVDVDVAMLDTPIDPATPDLNVVSNVDCFGNDPETGCDPGMGEVESPECFEVHGALVADLIAALDNGTGSVGVAPGARVWSVAVADKDVRSPSHCQWDPQPFYMSDVIAGVEWVTAHADDIEVANMSMRFPLPTDGAGEALDAALEEAIDNSIDAGVVYVAAAGNEAAPATQSIPAKYPRVITATAIYDSNGLSGGGGASGDTCHWPTGPAPTTDHDDTNSNASNYGPAADPNTLNAPGVDIAAPGTCTSNAAAHTTAAAAILASTNNPANATDVQTIRNTLITTGNTTSKTNGGYDDESGTTKEPLLDINNENTFAPATVSGGINPNPGYDVDGDGHSDLVTLRATGTGYVYGGQSGHTFAAGVASFGGGSSLNPALFDGSGHHVIDVADVSGDTRADLVTIDDGGVAHVYRGRSDRTFSSGAATDLDLSPALLSSGRHEPFAVADVNGNGRADLIVYDDQTRDTLVFPGQADATFGTSPVVADDDIYSALYTGAGEYFVDVADVTGDGRGDLVTMTTWNDVWVRPGQSNSTFGDPAGSYWNGVVINTSLHDGDGHEPIGVDDVTGDGRADLVTSQGGSVHVYPGLSSGYFSTPTSSFSGALPSTLFTGTGAELAAMMDVNGDGHADLVGRIGDTVYVAAGQAGGINAAGVPSLTNQFKSQQHFQNQNADGNEIVAEKPVQRRQGCRALGCLGPSHVESDVDGDHRSDLVTLSATGTGRVNAGTVAGSFSSEALSFAGTQALNPAIYDGIGQYAVDVADVTGDTRADLVTVDDGGTAHVYRGQSDRTFASGTTSDLDLSPALLSWGGHELIAVADVNGNGRADLVVHDDQTRDTLVYPGQSGGTFGTEVVAEGNIYSALHTGSGEYFVDVADVTGDGRSDLVTMTTWDDVWVRPGQSNSTFGDPAGSYWNGVVISTSLHDGSGHEPIGVDDVTGDGRADLVTSQEGSIHVYPGLASGYFASPTTSFSGALSSSLFTGTGAELAAIMDVNGDGHADLVAATSGDGVRIYRGNTTGTFSYYTTALPAFLSTQHEQNQTASGRELLLEKPSLRRRGCDIDGCS